MTPLFTVVVPTYNRASLLPRAIRSVLGQSFTDFELVVVDDGSPEDVQAVLHQFDDSRLRYVRQENTGLSAARNRGVAAGRGRYVAFLDDDDQALPGWLAAFAEGVSRPRCGLVCCGAIYVLGAEEKEVPVHPRKLGPVYDDQVGFFLAGTFAVRREIYEAIGGFALIQPSLHTTEFVFRLLPFLSEQGWSIESNNDPLVRIYRPDPAGRARALAQNQLVATYRLLELHRDRLGRSPRTLGDYFAVVGVNEARLGRYERSRAAFRNAIRACPWRTKHLARLIVASIPPVARRVW